MRTFEKDRKTSVSLPPAPCVGECKEVRFRGPTLRTEHRDTEHVSRGDWVVVRYLPKPLSVMYNLKTSAINAVVFGYARSSSLSCIKDPTVDTRHRSRHMGPVHGVTCLIIVNPQPTCGILLFKRLLLLFAIVTTYIGQALSLKASAVGSVDHYERNESERHWARGFE